MFSVTMDFSDLTDLNGKLDANIKKLAENSYQQPSSTIEQPQDQTYSNISGAGSLLWP